MKALIISIISSSAIFAQNVSSKTSIGDSERLLWITLSVVSTLAFLFSLALILKLKKEHSKIQKKQDLSDATQNNVVAEMSENVYTIVQEAMNNESLLSKKIKNNPLDNDLIKVMNSEKKLLDMTSHLIEFLRLKSKKVEISNDHFKFVNLLNDISGGLLADYENSNIELIYDVDDDIPYILIGDTLKLSTILGNLLDYCVSGGARKITMKISKVSDFSMSKKLNFKISADVEIDVDESVFNYRYNENSKKYEGLGLYIAKDLSLLMDGEIVAKNTNSKEIELSLTIPYYMGKETQEQYRRRLDKRLTKKRVLIVDDNVNSSRSLEKIFLNFKYSVKIEMREEYLKNLSDFSMYDIVLLDERLFTNKAIESLKSCNCMVVSLGNLFSSSSTSVDGLVTMSLKKPFTQERVFQVLNEIYIPAVLKDTGVSVSKIEVNHVDKLKVHREIFHDALGITLDKFFDFKGKKILLVEDNIINQKVITNILGKSGIIISVANNGEEAISLINSEQQIFDLVLIDINMPIMDGYTATELIRANSNFDALPIIALSALTSTDEVNQMFISGMNGFIAKPLRKEKLYTAFLIFMGVSKFEHLKEIALENEKITYEGIDVVRGVQQMNGNSELYKEVLLEFKDAYGHSDEILQTLVNDHRFEQAKMLCLDLKGLSGSICADDMYGLSTEIHKQLIYKNYDLLPKYLLEYSVEISKLNKAIELYAA